MKQLIFTLVLVVSATITSLAQMSISTNQRDDYDWDDTKKQWQLISEDPKSATLFEFNKDMTMFKHTTETISSSYYIKSKAYNDEIKCWEYEVVSDVGNKYKLILDTDNNNLRFIGTTGSGDKFLVRHTIKRLWKDL
jgi:hypothetical protein